MQTNQTWEVLEARSLDLFKRLEQRARRQRQLEQLRGDKLHELEWLPKGSALAESAQSELVGLNQQLDLNVAAKLKLLRKCDGLQNESQGERKLVWRWWGRRLIAVVLRSVARPLRQPLRLPARAARSAEEPPGSPRLLGCHECVRNALAVRTQSELAQKLEVEWSKVVSEDAKDIEDYLGDVDVRRATRAQSVLHHRVQTCLSIRSVRGTRLPTSSSGCVTAWCARTLRGSLPGPYTEAASFPISCRVRTWRRPEEIRRMRAAAIAPLQQLPPPPPPHRLRKQRRRWPRSPSRWVACVSERARQMQRRPSRPPRAPRPLPAKV